LYLSGCIEKHIEPLVSEGGIHLCVWYITS